MNRIKTLPATLILGVTLCACVTAAAQNDPQRPAQRAVAVQEYNPEPVRIVSLRNVDTRSAGNVVRATFRGVLRVADDRRTNSLVLSGPAAALDDAEKLLAELDKVAPDSDAELQTAYLHAPFPISNEFMDAAEMMLSRTASVVRDEDLLFAHGTASDIGTLRQMIAERSASPDAQTDSAESLTLTFFLVQADLSGGSSAAHSLPKKLEPVGRALTENGFLNPSLVSPLIVQVQSDQAKFRVTGVPDASIVSLSVEGRTSASRRENAVELQLSAEVNGRTTNGGESSIDEVFSLNTTMEIPFGEFVVLAASPSKTDSTEALALVVRVDPTE